MRVKIFVHPESKKSFWQTQALKAIAAEILRKRYTAEYLEADSLTDLDLNRIFSEEEKKVLLYIGYSQKETRRDLIHLAKLGIHTLLINYGSQNFASTCSRVRLNYRDGIEKCIAYLTANRHDRIALFGVNPTSSTDMLQDECFAEYLRNMGEDPARYTYYNYGSINECFARFAQNRDLYNAVICTNNVVALSLLHRLHEIGVRVPEDLYLISCGCTTMLAERSTPTITTIAVDQNEIGMQAVLAYATLMKNPGNISLTVRVSATLAVRGSTNFDPDPGSMIFPPLSPTPSPVNFYADPDAQSFFNAELLLLNSDELDQGIIEGILAGETYPNIAEKLYTSENVVAYRVKRMYKITGCQKKSELVALLAAYLK